MIVFEVDGHSEPFTASVPTQDDDGVKRAWFSTPLDHRSDGRNVTRIYSEWQPSAADVEFIERAFPEAEVTYSFDRPGPDGWEAAFAQARQAMAAVSEAQEKERVAKNRDYVSEHGE